MNAWHRWHQKSPGLRWTTKTSAFLLVLALVLFPQVWLVPTWVNRLRHMDSVLDPHNPALAPLEEKVRRAPDFEDRAALLQAVQTAVCDRIPYDWDWNTWGVMDYLPTVQEVFDKGREDCDGRAVVAASLLRRLGQDAWLASDILHVWVETPWGSTMSPTSTPEAKVLSSGAPGRPGEEQTRISINAAILRNLARGLSYGVAAFPLPRELIILAMLCLVTMHPWASGWRRLCGCLLLWIALGQVRDSGIGAAMQGHQAAWQAAAGFTLALLGWLCLAVKSRGPRPDSAARTIE